MTSDRAIAIIGGGIAGLTAALAIARAGRPVTVYEQAARFEEVGAGLQLSPNAGHALEALGLGPALADAATEPEAILIGEGRSGRVLARLPLGPHARERWQAPYRVVHRADLLALLVEAVRACANATIVAGERVIDYRARPAAVDVVLQDQRVQTFAGLIGADGLWSAVRQRAAGDGEPHYSGKVAWRATVSPAELPVAFDAATTGLWLGRDAHLVHYPVRRGAEINIVAVVGSRWREEGWSAPGSPAEILTHFGDWADDLCAIVAAPARWTKWALADRPPLYRWGDGPVTLAGDAAHPMLPFLAQGASLAIEDALVVAQELAADDAVAPAFRRYENRRMARVARAQREARANGRTYHLGSLAGRARDLALMAMGPERLLARLDWLYSWKP